MSTKYDDYKKERLEKLPKEMKYWLTEYKKLKSELLNLVDKPLRENAEVLIDDCGRCFSGFSIACAELELYKEVS